MLQIDPVKHVQLNHATNSSPLKLNFSSGVRRHTGKRIPQGTRNKNGCSVRAFAQFIQNTVQNQPAEYRQSLPIVNTLDDTRNPEGDKRVRLIVRVILLGSVSRCFDDGAKSVLRHFLSEFVVPVKVKTVQSACQALLMVMCMACTTRLLIWVCISA